MKYDLRNTFGKCEIEMVASRIIEKAIVKNSWSFLITRWDFNMKNVYERMGFDWWLSKSRYLSPHKYLGFFGVYIITQKFIEKIMNAPFLSEQHKQQIASLGSI